MLKIGACRFHLKFQLSRAGFLSCFTEKVGIYAKSSFIAIVRRKRELICFFERVPSDRTVALRLEKRQISIPAYLSRKVGVIAENGQLFARVIDRTVGKSDFRYVLYRTNVVYRVVVFISGKNNASVFHLKISARYEIAGIVFFDDIRNSTLYLVSRVLFGICHSSVNNIYNRYFIVYFSAVYGISAEEVFLCQIAVFRDVILGHYKHSPRNYVIRYFLVCRFSHSRGKTHAGARIVYSDRRALCHDKRIGRIRIRVYSERTYSYNQAYGCYKTQYTCQYFLCFIHLFPLNR